MSLTEDLIKKAKYLFESESPNLSAFEALKIAAELQRNEIFEESLGLISDSLDLIADRIQDMQND